MTSAVEHIPTDMTVTADASLTLAALQAELAKGGQWLPIDPPSPGSLTIANLLAHNLSGPRRLSYGTIRDYAIGLRVRLADGRTIKTGGKVVKNVAGYDLQKLFIGAGHTLGMIVEATFKLRPLPEAEQFVRQPCATLADAGAVIAAVLDSPLTPTVLDLHSPSSGDTNSSLLILGFDGSREEVEWQLSKARELGFLEQASLEYEKNFWATPDSIRKISVLPSRLIETIAQSGGGSFVARAGNGILYCPGAPQHAENNLPVHLWQRAREAFDPNNILAALPS
jgi:FAD/FMN-containing dehydrogenase